jgi:beta-lactamase class A
MISTHIVGKLISGCLAGALSIALPVAAPAWAQAPSASPVPNALADRIASLDVPGSGRLGIAAQDLQTGETVTLSGADSFPMASTVKIAIAAAYLAQVDKGALSLEQAFGRGRRTISASRLLEAMLIHSDNGASDILLRALGGPQAVDSWLQDAGIRGQRMDRTIARLVLDDRPPVKAVTQRYRDRRHRWHTRTVWVRANPGIRPVAAHDARDTSTPAAMVALLAKLRQGALLGAASTSYLFNVMERCATGGRRIKGMLPRGTMVAHKTGTLAGVSNDVGIVRLPNGHDLAVAIFAHGMRSEGERSRSIAAAARLLYDGFASMEQGAMGWGASR